MSDNHSKPSVLRSKLQLKKNNIESTDKDEKTNKIVPDDNCKTNKISDSSVNDKEDSISDFKSPQRVVVNSIKLLTSKPTNLRGKGKSKSKLKSTVQKKKQKSSKILEQSKKENLDNSQPLIESSFFKPKNNSESKEDERAIAYVCPLCFKITKNENIHSSHVKCCAVKNNISTKKLLEIVELQERQAQERKSLGLLAAPVLQDRKKPKIQKEKSQEDTELELAIALSKSLHEAEQLDELNEIAVLNGIPDKLPTHISEGDCKKVTLEKLGFTSNRPIVENTTNRIKKKKLYGLTVLQTRSQEERNRILTERIAEVLIGSDVLTQKQVPEQFEEDNKLIVLQNSILQHYHRMEDRLWERASLMSNERNFYVPDLSEYITPVENPLPELIKEENVENILKSENPQYTIESPLEKKQEKKMETNNTSSIKTEECIKEPFVNTLITDWGNALNNSSASDVIIFVEDNKHIWTHRLVFYVRCPNILLDIVLNNDPKFYSTKEKICWTDITFEVAFAFLEFIYCGFIKTHTVVFNDPEMLSSIRCLARKYKVKELFEYLRKVKVEYKPKEIKHEIERMQVVKIEDEDNVSPCEILKRDNESVNSNKKLITHSPRVNLTINLNAQSVHVQNTCVSPDIFDDTSDQISINKRMSHTSKDENTDLNMLLSLVNQDLQSSTKESDTPVSLKKLSSLPMEENHAGLRNNDEFTKQTSQFDQLECVSPAVKGRNEISIFIEKARRENAKGDSDFDSEMDSPLNIRPKSHGNPFRIHQHNESGSFCKVSEQTAAKVGKLPKKPSALSMLESDVRTIPENIAENLEKSNKIWIDDDKDELFDNFQNDESGANNINHSLTQKRVKTGRRSRPYASTSSEDLDRHESLNNRENLERSTLSLPNQERSPYTEFEKIRRHSSTQSQRNRTLEKKTYLSKSNRGSRKLSESSMEESVQKYDAEINMSTSFCKNDSLFSSTNLENEDEDTTHNACISSKRKKSSDSPTSQNSQISRRSNLERSDRKKDVSKSIKTSRKLSQSPLERSMQKDDPKPNTSTSFRENDSVFNDINLEEEDEDTTHNARNSSKRIKSSVSPDFQNSQSSRRKNLERSDRVRNSIDEHSHDILISDDEEDMEDVSMYTKYKQEHYYNSIAYYRAALAQNSGEEEMSQSEHKNRETEVVAKKHQDISSQNTIDSDNLSTTSTILLKERIAKDFPEENMDDSHLSLTQELIAKSNTNMENPTTSANSHIYDAETDLELENEDSVTNVRSFSQKFTNSSHISNDDLQMNAPTCSRKSMDKPKGARIQQNNSQANSSGKRRADDTKNSSGHLPNDENNLVLEKTTCHSPILISSSPDDLDVEFLSCDEEQTNDSKSNNLKPSEDPDDEIDSIFFKDLNLANVDTGRKKYNQPISSSINDLQDSPILNRSSNGTSRKKRTLMEDSTDPCNSNGISKRNKSLDLSESNEALGSPKCSGSAGKKLKHAKQLYVKSVSEDNISMSKSSTEVKNIHRFSSTQFERTPKKNVRKNSVHNEDLYRKYKNIFGDEKVEITDKDVTPPPDYDNMTTPELHKKLEKYGLKLQNRCRAVKLLTHIYNETHPLVPLSDESPEKQIMIPDTEDGSPLAKQLSQHNSDDDEDGDILSQNSKYINPGEMEFDDAESGPSTSNNPKSVAEAFLKLLQGDRDLHNRILMYEPINLMEVHATLKANGFKCKVDALMDYLDEQCITFCIPENSVKSRTRKK